MLWRQQIQITISNQICPQAQHQRTGQTLTNTQRDPSILYPVLIITYLQIMCPIILMQLTWHSPNSKILEGFISNPLKRQTLQQRTLSICTLLAVNSTRCQQEDSFLLRHFHVPNININMEEQRLKWLRVLPTLSMRKQREHFSSARVLLVK